MRPIKKCLIQKNCQTSNNYVQLCIQYMVGNPFAEMTAAWHGGPGCFHSGLKLIHGVVSGVSQLPVRWFTDHGMTFLNWPANSPDLKPIESLSDIVKRKLEDTRPNTLDELEAAIEASWASITPQQCHRHFC